jgi:hypothetical protein
VPTIVLDPATAVGDFVLNGNHQVLDFTTNQAVNTSSVYGTRWPCFGKASAGIPGGVHYLVQPPEIGHLCAEGQAGGTFVPRGAVSDVHFNVAGTVHPDGTVTFP